MSFETQIPDLSGLQTLIFDLDGVIWRGDSPIEGAAQSVARLRDAGRKCLFATNNSSRSGAYFVEKLARVGIRAGADDIVTSSTATAYYIAKKFPSAARVFVVGEDGIVTALQNAGVAVYTAENAPAGKIDVVVAGIDRNFDYEKLNLAQQYILRGATFIATNRDATFPVENGVVPGAGSIVAAIETASGTTPLSMGKPEPAMLQIVLERENAQPEQAAMIGDRLDTDIACGHRAGITSLLVATGVTSLETAAQATGEERPHAAFLDLPALTDAILGAP